MPDDGLAQLQSYTREHVPTVVLDTNILIHGCDNKPAHRYLGKACTLMDVRICDTVYWEFLRNVNVEKFRDRREFLSTWLEQQFLGEGTILREHANVKLMHRRLFLLLLHFHRDEPRVVLKYLTPDLWIAAVAIAYLGDHVFTANDADFSPLLFEPVAALGPRNAQTHLLRFKREAARTAWIQLCDAPAIHLQLASSLE